MVKTTATYKFILKNYPDLISQLEVKAAAMAAEGKTDSIPYKQEDRLDVGAFDRTWIDINAANEWISFVKTVIPIDPEIYPYTIEITA